MIYVYQNFSKNDKKQFDPLLKKGIQNEIDQFLKKSLLKNQEIVLTKQEDIRKPYWELNDLFKNFSKHLTRTYDGYSHRDLPIMIVRLLVTGHLLESNLTVFSPEGRKKILEMEDRMRQM